MRRACTSPYAHYNMRSVVEEYDYYNLVTESFAIQNVTKFIKKIIHISLKV
jgi:hypothetical protein